MCTRIRLDWEWKLWHNLNHLTIGQTQLRLDDLLITVVIGHVCHSQLASPRCPLGIKDADLLLGGKRF